MICLQRAARRETVAAVQTVGGQRGQQRPFRKYREFAGVFRLENLHLFSNRHRRGASRRDKLVLGQRDKLVIIAGNNDEMRRLGHEDTARETGSTGSNQVTFGREGIFAQRPG